MHEKSFPYSPQQSGVFECKHRHLLDTTRALMFQSKLPLHFWGGAILTATAMVNVLPSGKLGWKIPYNILYNKDPDYSRFKTFRCKCYYTNTLPHKEKFEARANEAVNLGFSPGRKGWKLFDLKIEKVIISRAVAFNETEFPYSSPTITSDKVTPTSKEVPNADTEAQESLPITTTSNKRV